VVCYFKSTQALIILLLFVACLPAQSTTGNFIKDDNPIYYPETSYNLYLTNLTVDIQYGILIGVNQFTYDQQWINFTALDNSKVIPFIHFQTQTYIDNASQPIQYLLLYLYTIANNSDTNPTLLDRYSFNLQRISTQTEATFWGMVIVVVLSSLVIINILYVIVKWFFD